MAELLQQPGFLNWTKGPVALEATKKALCGHVRSTWIGYLQTLEDDEIFHLPQFLEDINNDEIQVDRKRKIWFCLSGHSFCEKLIEHLNSVRYNSRSLKIVWKTSCTALDDESGLPSSSKRNVSKRFYWQLANTFMLYGGEYNDIPNSCPEDTDVAMILKMMKNCTLFEIDETRRYDKVIEIRNRFMHSGNYNVTQEELNSSVNEMIELLRQFDSLTTCKEQHKKRIRNGISELNEIMERFTITISPHRSLESTVVDALRLQKQAIEYDLQLTGSVAIDTSSLGNILEKTNDRLQEYTNSPEWALKEYERKKKEEERKREEEEEIKRPLNDQIEILQRHVEHLSRQIEQLQNREPRERRERPVIVNWRPIDCSPS